MKLLTSILLVITLGSLAPVSAQMTLDSSGTPVQAPAMASPSSGVTPARNINPISMNHKPSATPPPAELAAAIDKFYQGLKSGDYAATYDTFLAGSPMGKQTPKKSFFISKTQEALGIYGKLKDYELYDNYAVGSNVLVLTYLTRHDYQPLRWRFIYYRPDKAWIITNMGVDDQLMDMLD